jgi:hypothetical protein
VPPSLAWLVTPEAHFFFLIIEVADHGLWLCRRERTRQVDRCCERQVHVATTIPVGHRVQVDRCRGDARAVNDALQL